MTNANQNNSTSTSGNATPKKHTNNGIPSKSKGQPKGNSGSGQKSIVSSFAYQQRKRSNAQANTTAAASSKDPEIKGLKVSTSGSPDNKKRDTSDTPPAMKANGNQHESNSPWMEDMAMVQANDFALDAKEFPALTTPNKKGKKDKVQPSKVTPQKQEPRKLTVEEMDDVLKKEASAKKKQEQMLQKEKDNKRKKDLDKKQKEKIKKQEKAKQKREAAKKKRIEAANKKKQEEEDKQKEEEEMIKQAIEESKKEMKRIEQLKLQQDYDKEETDDSMSNYSGSDTARIEMTELNNTSSEDTVEEANVTSNSDSQSSNEATQREIEEDDEEDAFSHNSLLSWDSEASECPSFKGFSYLSRIECQKSFYKLKDYKRMAREILKKERNHKDEAKEYNIHLAEGAPDHLSLLSWDSLGSPVPSFDDLSDEEAIAANKECWKLKDIKRKARMVAQIKKDEKEKIQAEHDRDNKKKAKDEARGMRNYGHDYDIEMNDNNDDKVEPSKQTTLRPSPPTTPDKQPSRPLSRAARVQEDIEQEPVQQAHTRPAARTRKMRQMKLRPMNSTRFSMRVMCDYVPFNIVNDSVREKLQTIFGNIREACNFERRTDFLHILPWLEEDSTMPDITGIEDIPADKKTRTKYFYGCYPKTKGGAEYCKVYLHHTNSVEDLKEAITDALQDEGHALWELSLQVEDICSCGWLLFSLPRMDKDFLAKAISQVCDNIPLGLRWKAISLGKKRIRDPPKALFVECSRSDYPILARRLSERLGSRNNPRNPGGTKVRWFPEFQELTNDDSMRDYEKMASRQAQMEKATVTITVEQKIKDLDRRIEKLENQPTLRRLISQMKDSEGKYPLVHEAHHDWKNHYRTHFYVAKAFVQEAKVKMENLLTILRAIHGTEVESAFTDAALWDSEGQSYDPIEDKITSIFDKGLDTDIGDCEFVFDNLCTLDAASDEELDDEEDKDAEGLMPKKNNMFNDDQSVVTRNLDGTLKQQSSPKSSHLSLKEREERLLQAEAALKEKERNFSAAAALEANKKLKSTKESSSTTKAKQRATKATNNSINNITNQQSNLQSNQQTNETSNRAAYPSSFHSNFNHPSKNKTNFNGGVGFKE